MRGEGQIAELVAIAEPDVGVIVNVGPVHLELLGTVERVAAAKAELIRDLRAGRRLRGARRRAAARRPPARRPRHAHLRPRRRGDACSPSTTGRAEIEARGETVELELAYSRAAQPAQHAGRGGRGAGARACAVGGRVDVRFSSLRGEVVELPGGVTVVNDCYNANPMSMRAALDHLAASAGRAPHRGARRRWPSWARASAGYHREIGEHAAALGIDVLVTVGEDALALRRGLRRRDARGGHARGGRRAARGARRARATACWSRARARSGLERVLA